MLNSINSFKQEILSDQLVLSNFVSQHVPTPDSDNTQVQRAKIVISHYSDIVSLLNQVAMSYPNFPEQEESPPSGQAQPEQADPEQVEPEQTEQQQPEHPEPVQTEQVQPEQAEPVQAKQPSSRKPRGRKASTPGRG